MTLKELRESLLSPYTGEVPPAESIDRISKAIQPLLMGYASSVQSAVLADLLSLYLAGIWPPEARDQLLFEHLVLVHKLIPINEKELFGDKGHPGSRKDPM